MMQRKTAFAISVIWLGLFFGGMRVAAQDTVTGAFEGTVSDSQTGDAIAGANVTITNQNTGVGFTRQTDARGRFFQGLLLPGTYKISVSSNGFQPREVLQVLKISFTGEVVPVPVALNPVGTITAAATPTPDLQVEDTDLRAGIGGNDGARRGSFTEREVGALPLGGATLTRTFDELALLTPGVALPPQTVGNGTGPGVGAGVGSAGQFAVNGLRSRGNNFTVDGSDNNDEDIGVRRQGFLALVPQPIESIQEYQVITLLAPAQFGRNFGAQVNAVSKSGGNHLHGSVYGFFNASQLNARDFFDTRATNGNVNVTTAAGQAVLDCGAALPINCPNVGRRLTSPFDSGGENSFTFAQGGLTVGGALPLRRKSQSADAPHTFYFASFEQQIINAVREQSFAVPTVEQRGINNSGASGLLVSPFDGEQLGLPAYPTNIFGDTIFSLFPFPNNPGGVYGANTFTRALPASGRGSIFSGKIDHNWNWHGREQSITGRYNFTNDGRNLPTVGEALFSSLRARVRTQNLSLFLNSRVNSPDAPTPLFNQLRLSYGRTRLNFRELRDTQFLRPSTDLPGEAFLLNAPILLNSTTPGFDAAGNLMPNTGTVFYNRVRELSNTEDVLGAVGQVNIAGFSPLGVDVFNFPQNRVNNTYQLADNLSARAGKHALTFGTDLRRTELNSFLPRNARPLITFNGAPQLRFDSSTGDVRLTNNFVRPETFAAAAAASGFSQTLAAGGESAIGLRYYQFNFFAQDEWRVRSDLSLSFGVRYEYNTPPREMNHRIEDTFDDPNLSVVPGLARFLAGRTRIFEPDRNNFAPRVGIAYAPALFGRDRPTILRAGYGVFYDQILGAVVSQSRNVYPTYLTLDLAGGFSNLLFVDGNGVQGTACPSLSLCPFELLNPQITTLFGLPLVRPGTLNTLNPALTPTQIRDIGDLVSGAPIPPQSGFGATLPAPVLPTPTAQQFALNFEQQISRSVALTVAYVGTQGRHLLRFTTPNLGRNALLVPVALTVSRNDDPVFFASQPFVYGLTLPPGFINAAGDDIENFRPETGVGAINQFETTANSSYHALQAQLRFRTRGFSFDAAYTFSHARDDVSDVFDLAGASALPQNNFNLRAERGDASFDVRHRFTSYLLYRLPTFADSSRAVRAVFGRMEVTTTSQLQAGLPFTVNSIFDVNLDGNLTDRIDNENGLIRTGDGRQPLRVTVSDTTGLLAAVGRDGRVARNSFRGAKLINFDLALIKNWSFNAAQRLGLRVEFFNLFNHANFGLPVRYLEAAGFGNATATATPARRIQVALKYNF